MTVCNGASLLAAAPLDPMLDYKAKAHGVSHGLAECGYDLRIKQDAYFCRNRRFLLASTLERFQMPDNLVGVVHDKSSWARQGLSVLNTVIESGWCGWLTLELVYHGNDELHIPAGSGIAQVLFHRLENPASYEGRYNNQPDRPVPAIPATEGTPL